MFKIDCDKMRSDNPDFDELVLGLKTKDGMLMFLENSVISIRNWENDLLLKEIKPNTFLVDKDNKSVTLVSRIFNQRMSYKENKLTEKGVVYTLESKTKSSDPLLNLYELGEVINKKTHFSNLKLEELNITVPDMDTKEYLKTLGTKISLVSD